MPNETSPIDPASVLWKQIQAILADQFGVDEEQIHPHSKLQEDLGADSLDEVEITMAIDEDFGTDIPDAEAEKFKTAADIHAYLTTHTKHR